MTKPLDEFEKKRIAENLRDPDHPGLTLFQQSSLWICYQDLEADRNRLQGKLIEAESALRQIAGIDPSIVFDPQRDEPVSAKFAAITIANLEKL